MSDSGQDILGLQLVFHLQPSMGGAEDACSRVSGPDSPGQHFLGIFWTPLALEHCLVWTPGKHEFPPKSCLASAFTFLPSCTLGL